MAKEMEEEEREIQPTVMNPPNNLKSAIDFLVSLLALAFLAMLVLWVINRFATVYLVLAAVLFIVASCLNGIQIVQPPETWIVERLGKFNRHIEAGVHWTIPWVETIREKLQLYEQRIDGFRSIHLIVFRDGPAKLLNPRLYYELSGEHPEDAIYKVADYKTWAEGVSGPIIRGYLNTLTIDEALDEGAARGDILDKMRGRPKITEDQIKKIDGFITEIQNKISELNQAGKDTGLLEVAKKTKEDEKKDKENLLANQKKAKSELSKFEKQAQERGFRKIYRFTIGEFLLSEELKKARESIHQAEKERVAAVSRAITEATMRTEPITRAKERFKAMGFSEKEAREKAFMIDVTETLAKTGSLFLTGGGQDNIQTLVAQVAAIFTKATQQTKKAETGSKKETTT